jgi:uncharacterized protein YdaU (DUF1376 family)
MTKRKTNTNKMPWFKFYTADFVTVTMNLSGVERGIYVDLLRLFWEYGSLPDDLDKIRVRMMHLPDCRQYKLVPGVLQRCFDQTDDGRWFNPGFGDHHLQVSDIKLQRDYNKLQRDYDRLQCDGKKSNENDVPGSQEQNRTEKNTHTRTSVCGEGKEEPTSDSMDSITDDEDLELFRGLADKTMSSPYRLPTNGGDSSPDSSKPNDGGNGHSPTSPATDLDRAVATYLAGLDGHPKRASEKDVIEIRQELAKILEKDPIEVVMAALNYHMMEVWFRKPASYRSSPLGFLINGTWERDTPKYILTAARKDHRHRQDRQESTPEVRRTDPADLKPENWEEISPQFVPDDDGGCDDGSDRACE